MRLMLGVVLMLYSCSPQQSDDALIKKVQASLTEEQKDIIRGGKAFATYIAQVEGKIKDPKMIDKILLAAAEGNLAYIPDLAKPDTSGWRVEREGDSTFVVFYARARNLTTKKVYEASWRWSIDKTGRWVRFGGRRPQIREVSE
ncbi:MAG: hypothetical protein ACO2OT_04935 [Candidatus Caldipriscus sp.]